MVDLTHRSAIQFRVSSLACLLLLAAAFPQAVVGQDAADTAKAPAATQAPDSNAKAQAASDSPFVGFFKNETISLIVREDQGKFSGEMRMDGKATPFTATASERVLTGVFVRRGNEFKFVAELVGDSLTFELGLQSHQLKRSFDAEQFVGLFRSDDKGLAVRRNEQDFFGEFQFDKQVYRVRAKLVGDALKGTLSAGNSQTSFVATIKDRLLTIKTDGLTAQLRRVGSGFSGVVQLSKRESILAEMDDVVDQSIVAGPFNRRLGFVIQRKGKKIPVIDGEVKEFDADVYGMFFSPDAKRVGMLARDADGWHMIIDGKATGSHDVVGRGREFFSSDSTRWAFAGNRNGKWFLVSDGKESGELFDEIRGIEFSPNSRRISYVGRRGQYWHAVIDGKVGPPTEGILFGKVVFSPDSQRTAQAITRGTQVLVIAGDAESAPCDGIRHIEFNAGSDQLAFVRVTQAKQQVVIAGEAKQAFDSVNGFAFSPNGKRHAYAVRAGGSYHAMVDDQLLKGGQAFRGVGRPVFSADSERVVFPVAEKDGMFVLEPNGQGPTFAEVGSISFSPVVGVQMAYKAKTRRNQWHYVVGEQVGPEFDHMPSDIAFSPNGEHFAYVGQRNGEHFLCVNNTLEPIAPLVRGCRVQFIGSNSVHVIYRKGKQFVRGEFSFSR